MENQEFKPIGRGRGRARFLEMTDISPVQIRRVENLAEMPMESSLPPKKQSPPKYSNPNSCGISVFSRSVNELGERSKFGQKKPAQFEDVDDEDDIYKQCPICDRASANLQCHNCGHVWKVMFFLRKIFI